VSPRPIMVAIILSVAIVASGGPAAAQSMGDAPQAQAPTGAGEVETVQPFDTLDINVLQLDSLNRTVEVNSVGVITLPLAGDFNVVGKTTKQVAADIAERLGRHDLQNPEVTVTLKDPSQQTVSLRDAARRGFTVEGSVAQPGVYSVYGPTTLLQGIAMAKGIDQYANEKHVTIFRDVAGRAVGQTYNLNNIRDGKIADPPIYPRDTIVVASSKTRRFIRDFAPIAPLVYLIPHP
jgi:polysaccharide export outer membrane protein